MYHVPLGDHALVGGVGYFPTDLLVIVEVALGRGCSFPNTSRLPGGRVKWNPGWMKTSGKHLRGLTAGKFGQPVGK